MNRGFDVRTDGDFGTGLTRAGAATLVVAISREGLEFANEIAQRLSAPVDILAVQLVRFPREQRTIIGAVAADGTCVLEEGMIERLNTDAGSGEAILRARVKAETAERNLRDGWKPAQLVGRTVIVADNVITNSTGVYAACLSLKNRGAGPIVVVARVISPAALSDLESVAAAVMASKVEVGSSTPDNEDQIPPSLRKRGGPSANNWDEFQGGRN